MSTFLVGLMIWEDMIVYLAMEKAKRGNGGGWGLASTFSRVEEASSAHFHFPLKSAEFYAGTTPVYQPISLYYSLPYLQSNRPTASMEEQATTTAQCPQLMPRTSAVRMLLLEILNLISIDLERRNAELQGHPAVRSPVYGISTGSFSR